MRDLSRYYKEIEESHGKATAEATEYLYSLYTDGIYKWLAGIWDGKVGGFYYSVSARDNEFVEVKGNKIQLLPDIESTEQALYAAYDRDGAAAGVFAIDAQGTITPLLPSPAFSIFGGDDGCLYYLNEQNYPMRYQPKTAEASILAKKAALAIGEQDGKVYIQTENGKIKKIA